jgi:hypothetical protein
VSVMCAPFPPATLSAATSYNAGRRPFISGAGTPVPTGTARRPGPGF